MSHRLKTLLAVTCDVLLVGSVVGLVWGEKGNHEDAGNTPAPHLRARQGATVSLECGLLASERVGTPLSAAFELEGGKRYLVVSTIQRETFLEVIVDDTTGQITTVRALTSSEEITAATAHRAVMRKATKSLRTAAETALTAYPGFRALRVVPVLKDEQPVAEMTLVKDGTVTTVREPLE